MRASSCSSQTMGWKVVRSSSSESAWLAWRTAGFSVRSLNIIGHSSQLTAGLNSSIGMP